MNRLGKYQIRGALGKGAMGIVYEGFDPVIERTVAIKTILPSQLQGDQRAALMARFKREAQAAGRLNHPGIVAVYEYGEELMAPSTDEDATVMAKPPAQPPQERIAYIAMEFVKGRELKDLLDGGQRLPLAQVARLMDELLDALDHAHAQGVVHRDIKPANLIVLDNGRLKVADFGIARVEASELTQAGTVMGTPYYMSPEQFTGQPVDGRSDLFSCGVMLYQLLTGERPFTGETSNTIMYKVLREEPPPPSALAMGVPAALDAVVQRALAKNPAQRFQSAREFAQALQAAVAAQAAAPQAAPAPAATGTAQAAPRAATADAGAITSIPVPRFEPAAPRRRWGGPWVAAATTGVVVAAAGAALYVGTGRGTAQPPAQAAAPAAPPATTPVAAVAPTAPVPVPAAAAPVVVENGMLVVSALAAVDPREAQYQGDAAAAQADLRELARRRLLEKALALYVDKSSLEAHWPVLEKKLLPQSGSFIRTVLQEPEAAPGRAGLLEGQARAVLDLRGLHKALNTLSREERIELIRNQGDPRISIRIDIASAAGQAVPKERSQLAENVVKERLRSFGFRTWSAEGEAGANAQPADFAIHGEVRLKQLSAVLPASGLTITKTALTSWTIKAVDVATGEEVHTSTKLPAGQSWAGEDQALADIGKLVGDEFSRNFFLQNFRFRTQRVLLATAGLPEGVAPLLLRELRAQRQVLDAQAMPGGLELQLPEGDLVRVLGEAALAPLNARLGANCIAAQPTGAGQAQLSSSCPLADLRSRLDSAPPAETRKPSRPRVAA